MLGAQHGEIDEGSSSWEDEIHKQVIARKTPSSPWCLPAIMLKNEFKKIETKRKFGVQNATNSTVIGCDQREGGSSNQVLLVNSTFFRAVHVSLVGGPRCEWLIGRAAPIPLIPATHHFILDGCLLVLRVSANRNMSIALGKSERIRASHAKQALNVYSLIASESGTTLGSPIKPLILEFAFQLFDSGMVLPTSACIADGLVSNGHEEVALLEWSLFLLKNEWAVRIYILRESSGADREYTFTSCIYLRWPRGCNVLENLFEELRLVDHKRDEPILRQID